MRIAAFLVATLLLAGSASAQRTVVKMEPGGIKVVTMQTSRGTVIVRCDRNNVPIWTQNADGLDIRDICLRN